MASDTFEPPRRRWLKWVLLGGAGLAGVVGLVVVWAVAWLAYTMYEWEQQNECTSAEDSVLPEGSCAPPFTAQDFASGAAEVTMGEIVQDDLTGSTYLTYTVTNHTEGIRSWEWAQFSIQTPSGHTRRCWGDDSALRYRVPPGATVEAYGGCYVNDETGTYTVFYEGQPVNEVVVAP